MANLNRIILIGRLAFDPETRSTLDGVPMAKFKLVVDRPTAGADLIEVVAWRKAAEFSNEHLKKGKVVLVEGRIQIRSFEDHTGQRRWATEVVASSVRFLDKAPFSRQQTADSTQGRGANGLSADEELVDDTELISDLPF